MAQPDKGKEKEVPITIDRNPYKVTNPIKGSELYVLGSVAADYELYVESRGNDDDQVVENTDRDYVMEPGDKLYSSPKSLNPGH